MPDKLVIRHGLLIEVWKSGQLKALVLKSVSLAARSLDFLARSLEGWIARTGEVWMTHDLEV